MHGMAGLPFLVLAVVQAVKGVGHVALRLTPLQLFSVGGKYRLPDQVTARLVDRVCDVRVQARLPAKVRLFPVILESCTAFTAKPRPDWVLATTPPTAIRHQSAGHGHEETLGARDHLDVPDYHAAVNREAHEGSKRIARVFEQADSDFGEVQRGVPCRLVALSTGSAGSRNGDWLDVADSRPIPHGDCGSE